MTKAQFVEMISNYSNDLEFLTKIFVRSFSHLPSNLKKHFAERLYLKYVYEGKIFKCTNLRGNHTMYFMSMKDLMEYLQPLYPKAQQNLIYTTARENTKNHTKFAAYDHVFSYVENKEEL